MKIPEAPLPAGILGIQSLGNAGFAFWWGNGPPLLLDPYLSHAIEQNNPGTEFRRAYAPPFDPAELQAAGLLITHAHDDHFDPVTINALLARNPALPVALPGSISLSALHQKPTSVTTLDSGTPFAIANAEATPIQVEHGAMPAYGFLLHFGEKRVCHTGDTVVTQTIADRIKEFQPHILIAPINGQDAFRTARGIVGNMTGRDAADLAHYTGAETLIPTHYDLFPNNTENPAYLVDYTLRTYPALALSFIPAGKRGLF